MQEMRRGADAVLKNRITVRHGMLRDLKAYLMQSGWILEQLVGQYEVLRARRKGYPRPLIIYDRTSGGCGYSIDERDNGPSSEEELEERSAIWRGERIE